ncbi:sigma-54 interaction domain-containing protein [Desulfospira joergensenii]|uniref:sigma-54 interaction domain-containing protein n=1 Tax=Desulfospira joergensenii TaxID=53329 RepID=UPI0003B4F162|nr:sigma-54-dependent Fis family transcriptional regulator [Desulfospira joergensenii]
MKKIENKMSRLFPGLDMNRLSFLPLLEEFFEGILLTDHRGRVLFVNEEQARIDDTSPDKLVGKKVTEIYHVDDGESPTMQCIQTGKPVKGLACFYRTSSGKIVNSIHNIFPLYEGRKLKGTICFIQDFSIIEQRFEAVFKPGKIKDLQKRPTAPDRSPRRDNGTRFRFRDIIGESREFLETLETARLAARSASPVMLFGETGTGKELIAQSIHNAGARSRQQYVAVNCAAIPENLLEGILFGTSRGAFTGAVDKAGLFERANGGTLFLDEINSMTVGLQAKLLRFIQERKIRRVGSVREISIDLKLISSVNENPHTSIARGSLRADLFYRLAVVFIRIPPLKERQEDLPGLITHFLGKINTLLDKNVNSISGDVMNLFERYPWPGNVRELEHVIEGAMNIMGREATIRVSHLPAHLTLFFAGNEDEKNPGSNSSFAGAGRINYYFPLSSSPGLQAPGPEIAATLPEKSRENEILLIRTALEKHFGRPSAAARTLGISPQLLHYKLKKYRINRRDYFL